MKQGREIQTLHHLSHSHRWLIKVSILGFGKLQKLLPHFWCETGGGSTLGPFNLLLLFLFWWSTPWSLHLDCWCSLFSVNYKHSKLPSSQTERFITPHNMKNVEQTPDWVLYFTEPYCRKNVCPKRRMNVNFHDPLPFRLWDILPSFI